MKSSRYFLIALAILILLPLAGHLWWRIQKKNPMDLMIINKTVPQPSKNEVKTLNWVLNYNKVQKAGLGNYDFSKDYYGFYPDAVNADRAIKSFKLEDLPEISESFDGVFFLDNEGVEFDESNYSNLSRYGGFNNTDYLLLKEMIASGKLVVLEYNFFSEPTDEFVRYNTEQLLNIYSLHWVGKYFKNLNENKIRRELKSSWLGQYLKDNDSSWNYEGPGIILYNPEQERMLVMPEEDYLKGKPELLTDDQEFNGYTLPAEVCYTGWFHLAYPGDNEVISTLNLNLNERGIDLLKKNGLEAKFPALIKLKNKPVYFLSGDFSKQNIFLPSSKVRIINDAYRGICKGMPHNPHQFFQNYYVPLISGILAGYEPVKISEGS